MAKYDAFISYAHPDGYHIAKTIFDSLREKGCSAWMDVESLTPGSYWLDSIKEAISTCDYFIPIITESYNDSKVALTEISFALSCSKERSKQIIPIIATDRMAEEIKFLIGRYQWFFAHDMEMLTERISTIIMKATAINKLYEKLSEYTRLENHNKEAETICQLIDLLISRFQEDNSDIRRRGICVELHRLYTKLNKYVGGYDEESRKTALGIIETLTRMLEFINKDDATEGGNRFINDLFYSAFAVQAIYLDREIRSECADVLTNGDARNPCPIHTHIEKQKKFAEAFLSLYCLETAKIETYTDEEISLIEDTPRFLLEASMASDTLPRPSQREKNTPANLSKDDEMLISIAHFMQEGNKLFDALQQKRIEGSFLKCLLTSYERLKAYCQIVGAADVAAQCVERIVEIRDIVDRQENGDYTDDKAEKGIRSLLGFTLHGSGDYDVFICFKEEDSDIAETIYKYCQKHLKEPFWSKKSLPELSKSEYEDAIFDALRRSRHFIVVISNLDYLKTKWIKKEMATFDRAITEGRKTNANFLFVVTDGVYNEIIDSNKMCLDERYCGYQIIKMSEYETVLYKYLV